MSAVILTMAAAWLAGLSADQSLSENQVVVNGVTLVLMGDLHEARYDWAGKGSPMAATGCGDLARGGVTYELRDTIHEISNESCLPAVSLHLYSPPLRQLGAYDVFAGERKTVDVTDRPDVQVGGNPDIPA